MQGLAGRVGSCLRSHMALQLHDGIQAAILGIHDDQALPLHIVHMTQGLDIQQSKRLACLQPG